MNARVLAHCRTAPDRLAWLDRLPRALEEFVERWQLTIEHWIGETLAERASWTVAGIVRGGLDAFRGLANGGSRTVVLAIEVHAGKVLRARRAPWLAIGPKRFVGDPASNATRHLLNCEERPPVVKSH